ncbi:MAG: sulfatase [Candidatus Hydrogenedentota bacterium]
MQQQRGNCTSHTLNRRTFLAAATMAATGLTARGLERVQQSQSQVDRHLTEYFSTQDNSTGNARPADQRPNILLITTDQQWAGAMSCAGNPYVNTPSIDSIASNGVQFECAYCANPICVPSRTSYMTGTPSHENGVVTNMRPDQIDVAVPCLAKVLKDNGYDTGYVGKWHLPHSISDTKWSGFDFTANIRSGAVDFDVPASCAEFMVKRRSNPYFLVASFVNPHDICEWARRYSGIEEQLGNGEIGAPPPPDQCPPIPSNHAIPEPEPGVIRQHQAEESMANAYPTRDWTVEDDRWRQYLWGYYRMIELVDTYIGQVLEVLRKTGQEENTVIVFTSDHGDGMGAHRWNQKTLFYDEVSRIPFIVSWKGHTKAAARDRKRLVNMGLDLFPTMFDFAGIEKPAYLRGLSAAPNAMGIASSPTHPYIVSENNHHKGFGNPTGVHGRMLRTPRYKYIRYNEGANPEQLFDMQLDPGETKNIAVDIQSQSILNEHRHLLQEYIECTSDNFPAIWTE